MIRIFKLVVLLVISQVAFGQAPSNYTNINGRYRWIAGMFDSTFHIPKGSTPSLRTGGSTNSGGLFYNTSDSSVYTYTGTQWIKLRGSINPSDTTNKYVTQVYKKSGSDSVFYVKGGVHTWAFNDSTGSPGGGGGGKVYYFNGGVSMGTFGGFQMYELGDTANTGAAANFTRSTTGNIANFITDPGKPGLLQIPAGVWSVDAWLSETGGGANHAEIWIEVEKWDGSTITTIATSPIEQITEGSTPNLYSWSVSIPTTSLTVTDRIIIQFYISNTNGKTVTLYTQNGYVGEVHTTFTTGIGAINGLTAPAQYLVTGTSGTDFNINSSATATHTFNLPTASSMIRGALSPTDWSAFNNKIGPSDTASMLSPYLRSNVAAATYVPYTGATTNVNLGVRTLTASGLYIANTNALFGRNAANNSDYSLIGITGADKVYIDAGNLGTTIGGPLTLATLNNATVDTDAFLVSDGGVVKYRTGSEVLSDIGAASSSSISGTTNYIPKFTSSSAIGNSVIYESGGSIYVGGNLNLQGAVTRNINFYDNTNTNLNAQIQYDQIASNSGQLIFSTNNGGAFSERMRLDASGNLGLGTSSPVGKLNVIVSGSGFTPTSTGAIGGGSSTRFNLQGTESGIMLSSDISKTTGSPTGTQTMQLGMQIGFYAVNDVRNQIYYGNGPLSFVYSSNQGTSASEYMRLDASGNLGLGVTPSAWNAGGKAIEIGMVGSAHWGLDQTSTYRTTNAYWNSGWKYGGTGQAANYAQEAGNHYWSTAPSGTAGNTISFTQAMTLDASGRLGIGQTSPTFLLDLYRASNAIIRVLDGGTNNSLIMQAGSGTGMKITGYNYTTSTAVPVYISVDGANTILQSGGGNVGIGTTNPNGKLDVNTGTGATLRVTSGGTNILNVTNYSTADGFREFLLGGSEISFYSGTAGGGSLSERMRITSGGSVGIGTSNPNVYGSGFTNQFTVSTTSGYANITVAGSSGNSGGIDFGNQTVRHSGIYALDGSNLAFYTNGSNSGSGLTERMRITSGGELLINTTSDAGDYKLQVNGNVYTGGELAGFIAGQTAYRTYTKSALFQISSYQSVSGPPYTKTLDIVSNADSGVESEMRLLTAASGSNPALALKLTSSQNAEFAGSIKTAAPSGGTAVPWKLGNKLSTAVTLDTGNYIPVEVNGTTYYLALVTLN